MRARELAAAVLGVVVFFGVLEVAIRAAYWTRNELVEVTPLPYAFGGDYGPVPPWIDGVRMLEDDADLVWRARAGFAHRYVDIFGPAPSEQARTAALRAFWPKLADPADDRRIWPVELNSLGFRDREFAATRPLGTFRVVCLGDSWTFGANVAEPQSYPAQLERQLQERMAGTDVEVLNMGVLGYASHQGVRLLPRALAYAPDVVLVGFAMNEPTMAGYVPPQAVAAPTAAGDRLRRLGTRALRAIERNSEVYKLLHYWALLLHWHPTSPVKWFADAADRAAWVALAADPAKSPAWLTASLSDYERHLETMIAAAREAKARVILLYPEFWVDGPYLQALRQVARREDVPLVDASALLAVQIDAATNARAEAHGLEASAVPAASGDREMVEVVLRIDQGREDVPDALYVAGPDLQLGDAVPNRVRLYDDGSHGDQVAGDRVWSLAIAARPGATIRYMVTNSGREGEWNGLDVPVVREVTVEADMAATRSYAPIAVFGSLDLHADPWHTNAEGYRMIAGRIAALIAPAPVAAR